MVPSGATDPTVRPGPELLTVREVAAMARVSRMTIYRMIDDGRLPAVRVGNQFRVPVAAARELVGDRRED